MVNRLSGSSPFADDSDRDTLLNVAKAEWKFNDNFSTISGEAKDFISRLLVKDPRLHKDIIYSTCTDVKIQNIHCL